uniref:Uncharacterized protein n=1 Tax=Avena sativa TaxID=4498 RepID=A0ACD5YKM1_AVESA
MMGAAATEKKGGERISINWVEMFSSAPDPRGDDVCFASPPSAARKGKAKGNAFTRSSPDSLDFYPVSPPSAPAKGKGKRRREEEAEYSGRSNDGLRRDIEEMSDGDLRSEIAGLTTFGSREATEKRERRQRLLPLLGNEARRRRIRTESAKDGDGCNRGACSSDKSVYTFDIEDLQAEHDSRKYCLKSSPVRSTRKNYGWVGVQTRRSSNQTGQRKPIAVDKMYSSKTSPTALRGNKQRVHAVDPKEHDNEKSWQSDNNYCRNYAKRRKAHHEDSSLLHQKVNDVVLLDDEDVQPDEPVDCGVLDKWKELKIYYPSSDDLEAVELSSSDIRCLNPGVYLSSPVINYYIQYIKRAEMHTEYGTDKFYMFNTYFYSKLQEALLDKRKFLKLRRWWKGVNIFQRGYIILPIHGTSHWSLIIVCIPAKESNSGPIILHLDSLGMHPSAEIFDTVGRYLEEEWHHLRKNPPSDISISDPIWQDLPSHIHKEKVEVPGQNNAYDCGIFMLYYIRQFIKEAPERFTRDSLDMFSRSWFRSEVASDLRKTIRELLMELFGNVSVVDVMSEAAAPDGSDEDCVIKEGESEAVTPCDSSEIAVGGAGTSKRDEEDFMEVGSSGGTPLTTPRSDGMIGDCALSEAATLSDSLKDDDNDDDTRIRGCALSEAATLSDSLKDDDDDTMKIDPDSSKTEQDIEILPSDSSKTEQDIEILPSVSSKTEQDVEILPSNSSKNNEEVILRAPLADYCDDSDLEEVDHRSWRAKKLQTCQIS